MVQVLRFSTCWKNRDDNEHFFSIVVDTAHANYLQTLFEEISTRFSDLGDTCADGGRGPKYVFTMDCLVEVLKSRGTELGENLWPVQVYACVEGAIVPKQRASG